jgi:hypothetical protein
MKKHLEIMAEYARACDEVRISRTAYHNDWTDEKFNAYASSVERRFRAERALNVVMSNLEAEIES